MDYKCWYCERKLDDAPTTRWWIKKSAFEGICHDCVLSLARSVLASLQNQQSNQEKEE